MAKTKTYAHSLASMYLLLSLSRAPLFACLQEQQENDILRSTWNPAQKITPDCENKNVRRTSTKKYLYQGRDRAPCFPVISQYEAQQVRRVREYKYCTCTNTW